MLEDRMLLNKMYCAIQQNQNQHASVVQGIEWLIHCNCHPPTTAALFWSLLTSFSILIHAE